MRHADAFTRTAGRGFDSSSALCYPSVAGDQKWADASPPLPLDQPPSVRVAALARDVPLGRLYSCHFPPPLRLRMVPVAFVIAFLPEKSLPAERPYVLLILPCVYSKATCFSSSTYWHKYIITNVLWLYSSTRNDYFTVFVKQTFI